MLAIVSGRDTDFLARSFPEHAVMLVGNHGLEERHDGESRLVPEAEPYVAALARVAESAEPLVTSRAPGATVEKKRATVAIHVRQTAEPSAASSRLRAALAELATTNGLELREGRLVFELRPPVAIDKGQVLDRLVGSSKARAVLFAGDDTTDIDAFSALKRWRSRGLHTVAVAVRSSEAAPELFLDADLVVDGVPGIVQLLRQLAANSA